MKLFCRAILNLWTLAALVLGLFFLLPQSNGQPDDTDSLQKEIRARLAFDVAKGFFLAENYRSAIERLEVFTKLFPESSLQVEAVLLEIRRGFN